MSRRFSAGDEKRHFAREEELNDKLFTLVKSDILEEGRSNFYFRGVQDNIFDKIFRGRYADDIREFDPQEITNEYKALYEQARKKLHETAGKYSQLKGLF